MRSLGRDCVGSEEGQSGALEILTLRPGVKGRAHKGQGVRSRDKPWKLPGEHSLEA